MSVCAPPADAEEGAYRTEAWVVERTTTGAADLKLRAEVAVTAREVMVAATWFVTDLKNGKPYFVPGRARLLSRYGGALIRGHGAAAPVDCTTGPLSTRCSGGGSHGMSISDTNRAFGARDRYYFAFAGSKISISLAPGTRGWRLRKLSGAVRFAGVESGAHGLHGIAGAEVMTAAGPVPGGRKSLAVVASPCGHFMIFGGAGTVSLHGGDEDPVGTTCATPITPPSYLAAMATQPTEWWVEGASAGVTDAGPVRLVVLDIP